MTQEEREKWFNTITEEATKAGYRFPQHAAAEAALESNWGQSTLAKQGLNLFGLKQRHKPVFETIYLPTKEWDKATNQWITVNAAWIKYPDIETCLRHRLEVLQVLSKVYPNYKKGLEADNGEDSVMLISKTWATDPKRGQKVLNIYEKYQIENEAVEVASNKETQKQVPTWKDWVKSWWS